MVEDVVIVLRTFLIGPDLRVGLCIALFSVVLFLGSDQW